MENYQTAEGLRVPEALRPYIGGVDFIPYSEKKVKQWQDKLADDEKKAQEKANKKGGKGKKKEEEKKE